MVDLPMGTRAALVKQLASFRKTAGPLQSALRVDLEGYGGYSYPAARHFANVLEEEWEQVKAIMEGGEVGNGMFGEER